jgi:hypothetical protein
MDKSGKEGTGTHISNVGNREGRDPSAEIAKTGLRAPGRVGGVEVPLVGGERLSTAEFALGARR